MKGDINLLPQSIQRERWQRLYLTQIGKLLRRLNIAVLIMVFGLAIACGALYSIKASLSQKLMVQDEAPSDLKTRIQATNELLRAARDRTVPHEPWTFHVTEVLQVLPKEVLIADLTVKQAGGPLIIQGYFSARPALTAYEKQIRELSWVERVEAPLQNFATGARTGFTLTVYRKAAAL